MTGIQSDGYVGQANETTAGDPYNAMAFVVDQILNGVWTITLGKVIAVTGSAAAPRCTVDVQPMVSQIDGQNNAVPHGPIYGVPVFSLQGGISGIVADPAVGDIGLLASASRDISTVKTTKAVAQPGSFRTFDPADSLYLGGFMNQIMQQMLIFTTTGLRLVDKNGNSIAMAPEGTTLTDATGNVISTTSAGIALTPKAGLPVTVNGVLIVKQALQLEGGILNEAGGTYAGDIKTAGNVVAGFGSGSSVGLQTHTHTQPNDTHGDGEQPTNAPTGGT